MIRVKVKVSNDHRKATEDFECENLILPDDPTLLKWVQKVTEDFKDPVEEVTVTIKMDM